MSALEQALGGAAIEVVAKATRRRFTVEYKRKIVREADGCKTPGAVGALLRREGLYSSHLTTWRAARERGELAGAPKKRGPVRRVADPRDKKLAEQEREISRWKKRATLAEQFIRATCARQGIGRDQLTIHADRGQAMVSKSVAFLLADLGVTKTHSRPHVSNDNPFSEAQFKTLKYRPAFPDRFGSIQDARAHGQAFFAWYNTEHHHSGLGLLTPHDVHFGLAEQRVAERAGVLATAYAAHPERFPAGRPAPAAAPTEVWINPPKPRP